MLSMLKYIAIMAVFYILSDKVIKADLAKPMQTFSDMALYSLVFIMGMRIGANEEVISKLGSVGLQALATTFLAFFGSVFMAFLVRTFMMLDRHGLGKKRLRTDNGTAEETAGANGLKSTAIIFSLVALGMAAGHFIVPEMIVDPDEFQEDAGTMIDICLCILLAGVGYGLGTEGKILHKIRSIGFRVLGLPIAIMSGTAIMGLAYGIYGPLTLRAPLAIFMVGRSRGNFHKQMVWLMAVTTMYAVAFFIFNNPTYGMVHMACWFTVPLLSLYNGQRGKLRWLGTFFYWYYPVHMALIGLVLHLFPV